MNTNAVALILKASAFAAENHRHQRRKDADTSPYINHPIAVADTLASEGDIADPVVLCAALLHDTVEDTETAPAELAANFGADIAAVVAEVTDDKSLDKGERKRLQVENAPHASARAQLVKLADKICNLRDIDARPPSDWPEERKSEYYDWAKAVVDGLRGVNPALEAIFDALYDHRNRSFAGRA